MNLLFLYGTTAFTATLIALVPTRIVSHFDLKQRVRMEVDDPYWATVASSSFRVWEDVGINGAFVFAAVISVPGFGSDGQIALGTIVLAFYLFLTIFPTEIFSPVVKQVLKLENRSSDGIDVSFYPGGNEPERKFRVKGDWSREIARLLNEDWEVLQIDKKKRWGSALLVRAISRPTLLRKRRRLDDRYVEAKISEIKEEHESK